MSIDPDVEKKQWVVLVLDPENPMKVIWAIGPFPDGEMAFAYMEERDYPDSMIMQLTDPPDDAVPALIGA